MDSDSEKFIRGWSPTPLNEVTGQNKPSHGHTNPSFTVSSVTTGKEQGNIDPRNENFKKILTMRKLAMQRLDKVHKNGVLTHNWLLKDTQTFATGKKYFLK